MLQWMGGSRRKVTTSRKSTQNRQKQYFEQRKRQQQTPGLELSVDRRNKRAQYHEEPRSLDILSLINLSSVAVERNSGTIHASKNSEDGVAHPHCHVPERSTTSLVNKIIPGDSDDLKEAKAKAPDHGSETLSLKNKFSVTICSDDDPPSHNCPSNEQNDRLDDWKMSTEKQLVLDFLSDDEHHGCSEGRSVHEAHVAFSVEGLGKMGTATPVHSPRETGRMFSTGFSSQPKVAHQLHSSKNIDYIMDDLELEMSATIHDSVMSPGYSPSPFNLRPAMDNSGCLNSMFIGKRPESVDLYESIFGDEECFYNNIQDKNEETFPTKTGFLDDNACFLDERDFGAAWKNPTCHIDNSFIHFSRPEEHETSDYGFEDSYLLNTRDARKHIENKRMSGASILSSNVK